jgi:DNA repair and recombination protein RAD54B
VILTVAEQNPYASPRPVVEKVLIVCPVSLVNVKQSTMPYLACNIVDVLLQNWKAEFHKWLGRDRVGIVTCDKDRKTALTFMNASVHFLNALLTFVLLSVSAFVAKTSKSCLLATSVSER